VVGNLKARAVGAFVYAFTFILYMSIFNTRVFAIGPKIQDTFSKAGNYRDSGSNAFSTSLDFLQSLRGWIERWYDSLGSIVPILAGIMVVLGLIAALTTSFSKKLRGTGLGISIFAFLMFLLWLFTPTIAKIF